MITSPARYLVFLIILSVIQACGHEREVIKDPFSVFQNSNAVVVCMVEGDQHDSYRKNCSDSTFFEAASLTKTLFAQIVHERMSDFNEEEWGQMKLYLRHAVNSKADPDCNFKYSDSSYLLAGQLFKEVVGDDFGKFASPEYRFNYSLEMEPAHGYISGGTFARRIREHDTALANGTLYLNEQSASRLLEETSSWVNTIRTHSERSWVCGFKDLYWLNGIGVDSSLGRPLYFQWGNNWCYNNIILLDPEKDRSFVVLTNSVIGAHEIAVFFENVYQRRLELFNYIDWW